MQYDTRVSGVGSCDYQSNSARCWWFCSLWGHLAQSPTRSLASVFIQDLYVLASSPLQIFEYLVETAPQMFDHKKHKNEVQVPSKWEDRYMVYGPCLFVKTRSSLLWTDRCRIFLKTIHCHLLNNTSMHMQQTSRWEKKNWEKKSSLIREELKHNTLKCGVFTELPWGHQCNNIRKIGSCKIFTVIGVYTKLQQDKAIYRSFFSYGYLIHLSLQLFSME